MIFNCNSVDLKQD